MKAQLIHIYPYLPYILKGECNGEMIAKVIEVNLQLSKEIELNGQKFIPISNCVNTIKL